MGMVKFIGKPGVSREGMEGGGTLLFKLLGTCAGAYSPPEAWSWLACRTVHGSMRPDCRQVCTHVEPSVAPEEGKRVYS